MADYEAEDRPTNECNTEAAPGGTDYQIKMEIITHGYGRQSRTELTQHGFGNPHTLRDTMKIVARSMVDDMLGVEPDQFETNPKSDFEDPMKLYYAQADGARVTFRHIAQNVPELMSMLAEEKIRVANGRSGYIVADAETGKQVFISSFAAFIGEV